MVHYALGIVYRYTIVTVTIILLIMLAIRFMCNDMYIAIRLTRNYHMHCKQKYFFGNVNHLF